jgi:hypothetical protein
MEEVSKEAPLPQRRQGGRPRRRAKGNAPEHGEFYHMAVELTSKLRTEKAREARVRANEVSADLARNTMLRIAASCDKRAEYAALGKFPLT